MDEGQDELGASPRALPGIRYCQSIEVLDNELDTTTDRDTVVT